MTLYDWDPEKAASNIVDQDGITFEEGITALLDEYVFYEGQRYYDGEYANTAFAQCDGPSTVRWIYGEL